MTAGPFLQRDKSWRKFWIFTEVTGSMYNSYIILFNLNPPSQILFLQFYFFKELFIHSTERVQQGRRNTPNRLPAECRAQGRSGSHDLHGHELSQNMNQMLS